MRAYRNGMERAEARLKQTLEANALAIEKAGAADGTIGGLRQALESLQAEHSATSAKLAQLQMSTTLQDLEEAEATVKEMEGEIRDLKAENEGLHGRLEEFSSRVGANHRKMKVGRVPRAGCSPMCIRPSAATRYVGGCRLEGGHLTCCQVERTLSQRRISCSGARRGTLVEAQQAATAATAAEAAQRELQIHAEMHDLEMQLQGLEELKTQLSGACRRVHTANSRPGGAVPPYRSRLGRTTWPTCLRRPRAQAPEGCAALGTVRVSCTCEGSRAVCLQARTARCLTSAP